MPQGESDKLKRKLRSKGKMEPGQATGLSTGSTLLNLACSGKATIGFLAGHYYFLVGDSASGKTFLSLTCLAEAARNPAFANYRFIFDNAEDGALMDIKKFFGEAVSQRMEPACWLQPLRNTHWQLPAASMTVEEFFYNLDDACEQGKPFIYILDSMDCLSTDEEVGKFAEAKNASRKGKETTGSYGTSKAKLNSANIRRIIPKLRQTGSILIIISQTRDNLGYGFEKKTRSGGHALRFYATLELWSSIKGKLRKTVKGKERQVGITCQVQVKKNRLNGKERTIELPIYHTYGIDDIGSMVNWLVEEGHWQKSGSKVVAPEFSFEGATEALIRHIEEQSLEKELRLLVAEVWHEIEKQCESGRKRRYE